MALLLIVVNGRHVVLEEKIIQDFGNEVIQINLFALGVLPPAKLPCGVPIEVSWVNVPIEVSWVEAAWSRLWNGTRRGQRG